MPSPCNFALSGVCERDIDLLLLEEFLSSPDFLFWWMRKVWPRAFSSLKFLETHRSVTQSNGESDLEITLIVEGGCRVRLLIENKVNAALQPMQAERYKARGASYVAQGHCEECFTILAAPRRYFGDGMKGFDAVISYEDIQEWFDNQANIGDRSKYKSALLHAGIDKGVYGYQPIEDDAVGSFWKKYWLMALENAPELEMAEPKGKPAGASFIDFRPATLPKGVVLVHKLSHGNADIQFSGYGGRLSELRDKYGNAMEADMSITSAAKSGAIRIKVPVVNVAHSFEEQMEDTLHGLLAIKRLYSWFLKQ
jgi:hypothetical protein